VRAEALAATLAAVALALPAVAWAAQPRAAIDLHSGGLVAQEPEAVELPTARVSGRPVTVEAPVGPFRITDTRAGRAGWTLVVVARPPADALGRSVGAPLVVVPRAAGVGGAGTRVGTAGPIDAPRAVISAPGGAGLGLTEVTPLLRLTVPGDAPSAVYATTMVVTIS
jgi:hypothetical protein